jgi:hypothetical protein
MVLKEYREHPCSRKFPPFRETPESTGKVGAGFSCPIIRVYPKYTFKNFHTSNRFPCPIIRVYPKCMCLSKKIKFVLMSL